MDTVIRDLRHALRQLLRAPGFTVTAVLTLALGLGSATAIFAFLHGIALRALPYPFPDRLVIVREVTPSGWTIPVSPARLTAWQAQRPSLGRFHAARTERLDAEIGGRPQRLQAAWVSAELLGDLGITVARGRDLGPTDSVDGAPPVAVISDRLWRQGLAEDPSVVGRSLQLEGGPVVVVGVLPPTARPPEAVNLADADVWLPLGPRVDWSESRSHSLQVLARLDDDVTTAQAEAAWAAIGPTADGETPFAASLAPLAEETLGSVPRRLWWVFGAVGVLLTIACVNVAYLLLARAARRRHEQAVRSALGARRRDLLRQEANFGLLLAFAGALIGLLLASWGVDLLSAWAPDDLPRRGEVRFGPAAAVFGLGLASGIGLIFGVLGATRPAHDLRTAVGGGHRASRGRLRGSLVGAQVALSLILAVGAGLLAQSFLRLTQVETGFSTTDRSVLQVELGQSRYGESDLRRAFIVRLEEKVAAHPTVDTAGVIDELPLTGSAVTSFRVPGFELAESEEPRAGQRTVTPGYRATMEIPLIAGRDLAVSDRAGTAPVALVNTRLARRFWPDREPVGATIEVNGGELTVVGVVGDVRHDGLAQPAPFEIYLPLAQAPRVPRRAAIIARGAGGRPPTAAELSALLWQLDPQQPVRAARPLTAIVASGLIPWRSSSALLAGVAALALALVVVGVYGVVACSVAGRRRELGIRLAIGARAADITRLVLRGGLMPVIVGIAIGSVAGLGLSRLLTQVLYETAPVEPGVLGLAVVAVVTAAGLACWLPARRAARLDPVETLREE